MAPKGPRLPPVIGPATVGLGTVSAASLLRARAVTAQNASRNKLRLCRILVTCFTVRCRCAAAHDKCMIGSIMPEDVQRHPVGGVDSRIIARDGLPVTGACGGRTLLGGRLTPPPDGLCHTPAQARVGRIDSVGSWPCSGAGSRVCASGSLPERDFELKSWFQGHIAAVRNKR